MEMSPTLSLILGIGAPVLALVGVGLTVWASIKMKRGDHRIAEQTAASADIATRFDDASQLAQYIREEVERQVQPIRDEMQRVKSESHEMHDAVRARETQLWMWNIQGRSGQMPELPNPILTRLGIAHLSASVAARIDAQIHEEPQSPIRPERTLP